MTPDPEEFAKIMEAFKSDDNEGAHVDMDNAMVKLLCDLGYEKAMSIYSKQEKWYA